MFDAPANPYTHSLLSAIPEPDPDSNKERVTLRGTPPSPRDPPVGCPFSTRCPAKIRPEAYREMDDDMWERIEVFREVIRERSRAERSISDRVRELLGKETRFSDISEIMDEVFGDVEGDLPDRAQKHLREAASYVEAGNDKQAREYLHEEFGSVCDKEKPRHHPVTEFRTSFCHRHLDAYEDSQSIFRRM
jgi:peptide/nickel transport system ATP-binding protein